MYEKIRIIAWCAWVIGAIVLICRTWPFRRTNSNPGGTGGVDSGASTAVSGAEEAVSNAAATAEDISTTAGDIEETNNRIGELIEKAKKILRDE